MPQTDNYPTAKTAEELARALGLSELEAQQWQVQYGLLKQLRQAVSAKLMTDAEIARKAGCSRTRVAAIRSGNLDNVSTALLARLLAAVYPA
jgi:transcriptional regulator with XRE-family HTH domain